MFKPTIRNFRKRCLLLSTVVVLAGGVDAFIENPRFAASAQQSQVQSAPADHSAIVRALLNDHWDRGKSNRLRSQQLFQQAATDRKVLTAYVLNRMKHNRNRQARDAAEKLTEIFPQDVDGWTLRIWLDAVTNDYERALIAMTSLKKVIDDVKTVLDDDTRKMILQRLGRLIGYMQGPVGKDINQDTLQMVIEKVFAGLNADQLKLINEQRERVLKQYDELSAKRVEKEKDETEKAVVQIQNQTQLIKDQNLEMERRESNLIPQLDSLRQEANQKVGQLQSQIEPLERMASSVVGQIEAAAYDLQLLRVDLIQINDALYHDPYSIYWQQRHALVFRQIRNREIEIASMQADLNRISLDIGTINSQIARTSRDYEQRIGLVQQELSQINRAKRNNIKRLGKLAKGPRVSTAKLGAMDNRVVSLTTYDPFPIELYRQYLWERLK